MLKTLLLLLVTLLVCGEAYARDEFEGVRCDSDIPGALIGKRTVNDRVVQIQARHKELGLEDMGGIEISDRLFLISWRICGHEFELLTDNKSKLIRDVLAFPPHSKKSPEFIGDCQIHDKKVPVAVVAVLDNSPGYNARDGRRAKTLLKATAAWKIDEAKDKLVGLSTAGLVCPLGGIITLDGGP